MNLSDVTTFILRLLEYVLPAVFVWSLTERAVRAIVSAATGNWRKGL